MACEPIESTILLGCHWCWWRWIRCVGTGSIGLWYFCIFHTKYVTYISHIFSWFDCIKRFATLKVWHGGYFSDWFLLLTSWVESSTWGLQAWYKDKVAVQEIRSPRVPRCSWFSGTWHLFRSFCGRKLGVPVLSKPTSWRLFVQVVATFRNGRYDLYCSLLRLAMCRECNVFALRFQCYNTTRHICHDRLQEFIGRFSISLLLRFGFSFVSVTDLYQESLHAAHHFSILQVCACFDVLSCDYIEIILDLRCWEIRTIAVFEQTWFIYGGFQ